MSYSIFNVAISGADGSPGPGYPVLRWSFPHDAGATSLHLTFYGHDWTGGWYHVWVNSATAPTDTFTPTIRAADYAPGVVGTMDLTLDPASPAYFQIYTGGFALSFSGQLDIGATFGGGVTPTYCAYGTTEAPGVVGGIIVSTALIDVLLTMLGLNPAWAILFDAFVGRIIWGGDLCAGPPPEVPTFTPSDFIGFAPNVVDATSRNKFWNALLAMMWPKFCICNPPPPGSPTPIAYPPPDLILPVGAPTDYAPITCSSEDLCTTLNSLSRQLLALSGQMSYLRSDVTLIQRQKVPFAYLPGVLHSGLTGNGQFAVSGILGLAVQVTTVPGAAGEEIGDPVARFGLGWVTTGTADGWRRSVAIRHNPQWVEVEGDDTLVGYSLEPLVVANIEEFVREP